MIEMTLELTRAGFDEVPPERFYRDIFPDGELDAAGEFTPGKYVGIAIELGPKKRKTGKWETRRYTLLDDMNLIDELQWHKGHCFISPISYAGKRRDSSHARYMYALCIELDNLKPGVVDTLQRQYNSGYLPKPSYIVASGSGLHLYYKFERPVPLYKQVVKQLQGLKRHLTVKLWNRNLTYDWEREKVQQESIFQAFRMPGTLSKKGERVTVHKVGEAVTIEYLNRFVPQRYQVDPVYREGRLTLREAQAKYPEWYQERVIEGRPKKRWATNRRVYEWWRDKLDEVEAGHRYYCLMLLAIYAIKCSIFDEKHNPNPVTREELEQDCMVLTEYYIERAPADKPFSHDDMMAALQAWDDKELYTYPLGSVMNRSGFVVERNRRNGRTQAEHLEIARAIREIQSKHRGEPWNARSGRPAGHSKERETVIAWHAAHPDSTRAECSRATGIHRNTVARWWHDKLEQPTQTADKLIDVSLA